MTPARWWHELLPAVAIILVAVGMLIGCGDDHRAMLHRHTITDPGMPGVERTRYGEWVDLPTGARLRVLNDSTASLVTAFGFYTQSGGIEQRRYYVETAWGVDWHADSTVSCRPTWHSPALDTLGVTVTASGRFTFTDTLPGVEVCPAYRFTVGWRGGPGVVSGENYMRLTQH